MLLVDYYEHPDCVDFDISEFRDIKIETLASHGTQFTSETATNLIEFMNKKDNGKYFERFRYVRID